MRKNRRIVAALAISLFLALGAANAGSAGIAFLSPGYDGASFASSIANRADARLERASGSAGASVEISMGKAGIAQWLSAY